LCEREKEKKNKGEGKERDFVKVKIMIEASSQCKGTLNFFKTAKIPHQTNHCALQRDLPAACPEKTLIAL